MITNSKNGRQKLEGLARIVRSSIPRSETIGPDNGGGMMDPPSQFLLNGNEWATGMLILPLHHAPRGYGGDYIGIVVQRKTYLYSNIKFQDLYTIVFFNCYGQAKGYAIFESDREGSPALDHQFTHKPLQEKSEKMTITGFMKEVNRIRNH